MIIILNLDIGLITPPVGRHCSRLRRGKVSYEVVR